MKAFILGDFQSHAWGGPAVTQEGVNERLMDIVRELRRIRKLALAESIQYLFILGDIFEERGKLDIVVQNMIYREILSFRKKGIKVVFVLGNHDKYDVGDFHSLEVFKEIAMVIDKPAMLDFDKARVLAIPFNPEPKKVVKILRKRGKQADLILMHTSVLNVKMNSGAKWKEGIPLKSIPKKPYTFIGHDHTRKKLRKRVFHVGSLLHVDAGDKGQRKAFVQFHSEGNHNSQFKWIRTQGPEFVEFKMPYSKQWKKLLRSVRERCEGNFVKLHYDGPLDKRGKIIKFITRKLHARSAEVIPIVATEETPLNVTTRKRLKEMLKEYAKKHIPEADRETAILFGKKILKEALHYEEKA